MIGIEVEDSEVSQSGSRGREAGSVSGGSGAIRKP